MGDVIQFRPQPKPAKPASNLSELEAIIRGTRGKNAGKSDQEILAKMRRDLIEFAKMGGPPIVDTAPSELA